MLHNGNPYMTVERLRHYGIGNVDMECFEKAIKSALPDIKLSEGNSVGFCISGGGR